jgi:hypothetical protein
MQQFTWRVHAGVIQSVTVGCLQADNSKSPNPSTKDLHEPLTSHRGRPADFSDNSVGIRYGSRFSNPGTNDNNIHRTILNFTHFSVDKLGTNLFTVDLLKSGSNEPAVGGGGGAQEVYGFYSRNWSYSKFSGTKMSTLRDVSLTTRLDFGTKNDAFGGRPLKVTVGPTLSLDIPGFFDVGAYVYKETNHNGIVGKDVTFDATWKLGAAWSYNFTPAVAFSGFIDFVGPKGTDGFGNKTKTETLSIVKVMADTGILSSGKSNGLLVGVGLEYWRHKFGNDPAKNPAGTTKETTPMLMAEYHF